MSPESLIEKLESLGMVDARILMKLRKQIANPEKTVTVKKILSFLVKNDFISKSQALELTTAEAAESKPNKPSDSDELLMGVKDPSAIAEVEVDEVEVDEIEDAEIEVAGFDDPLDADDNDLEAVGDEPPTMIDAEIPHDDEYMHDETMIIDPIAAEQQYGADPLADPVAGGWDESTPMAETDRPGKRIGFEGKLDSQDQWATKWVYIGFATLGLLLVAGTLLVFVLSLISAEDRFEAANKSFEDGTYGDAIKKFEEFLDKHGSHEKAPLAKVKLAQSMLADTFKQKNWDETIVRAGKQLPPLIEDDSIDLEVIRQDLAVMLPTSTLEIAKRATRQESKSALIEQLAKAKSAKTLVDNPVYIPNSRRKQATVAKILDDIDEEIAKGDGLIRKQDEFESALSQITASREQGETDKAFEVYNQLIRSYGDLRANEQLQSEMRVVSQMESKLVKPLEPGFVTSSDVRASPVESTIVLASKSGTPIQSMTGEIIPVLTDGSVYGVDIGSGDVMWRRYVGYQTNIQPLKTDADKILYADQSNHDLILVNAADGNVVWRDEIGEPFLLPQIDENVIYLTTAAGNLLKIDLATGNPLAAVTIPQSANVPMARSSRNGLVYQPGLYSNLYVLSEDDLSCNDVFYLGHYKGSISVPPVIWNNYILIAVNQSGVCDLNVLHPNPESGNLELVQRIRRVTRGIVTNPLIRFGRFMLINSETGDLKILEINPAEESTPIRILAQESFENRDEIRTYLTTAGSQLWIGSKGIMRYKVSRALGTFERQEIANPDDFFIGPIRKFGDAIVHLRKRAGSALTSISAVDAESLKQIWRTDIGGPLAGRPVLAGSRIIATSSQGDLFSIDDKSENQVASDAVKSSNIVENLLFDETIDLTESTKVCVGPPGQADILHVDIDKVTSDLIRLPAPADKAACRPIVVAGDLIIPSKQGQIVRVDPTNGRIVGTPFLPPVSPGTEVNWQRPALLDSGFLVAGAGSNLYLIDATDNKLLRKAGELGIEGELRTPLAAIENSAFAVVKSTATEKLVKLLASANGLELSASVDLPAPVSSGPWMVGNQLLVRLENNQLAKYDSQLKQIWSVAINAGTWAADPILDGAMIKLFYNDGSLKTLSAESGETVSEFNLGQPIVHEPVFADDHVYLSGLDGTIHKVRISQ